MRPELYKLVIKNIIIHEIPKKLTKRYIKDVTENVSDSEINYPELRLSNTYSEITDDIKQFFLNKIKTSIVNKNAVDVLFDNTDSEISILIQNYFENDNEIDKIEITKQITNNLFEVQSAVPPAGLLQFTSGEINGEEVLFILKIEREDGVRLTEPEEQDQNFTIGIERVYNLLLTKKTKLFKIVMFYHEDNVIKGVINDYQRGGNQISEFFMEDFLKCKLAIEPQAQTKEFYEKTIQYINNNIKEEDIKSNIIIHLLSELNNQNRDLNPDFFIRSSFPTQYRDDFNNYLKENNLNISVFRKDNTLIKNKLKKMKYEFKSGIKVEGPYNALKEHSRHEIDSDGNQSLIISDSIDELSTK